MHRHRSEGRPRIALVRWIGGAALLFLGALWLQLPNFGFLLVSAANGHQELVQDLALEELKSELPQLSRSDTRNLRVAFFNCSFHETQIHENFDTYQDIFGWHGLGSSNEQHLDEFIDDVITDCTRQRRFRRFLKGPDRSQSNGKSMLAVES